MTKERARFIVNRKFTTCHKTPRVTTCDISPYTWSFETDLALLAYSSSFDSPPYKDCLRTDRILSIAASFTSVKASL